MTDRTCALVLVVALAACGDPDPAPTVQVTSAAPAMLDPADDSRDDLAITVRYADADGDLGRGSAEVHDCRAPSLGERLVLPAIASDEAVAAGVAITGELVLQVDDVGAVEPASEAPPACADLGIGRPAIGVVIFCVYLTDAAGHTGPGDCTDPVAIAR